jgi:endonuclease-8
VPEGHTLHRLARLHQRRFGRAPVVVSSPQGRFVDGAAAVNGHTFTRASAWGKHLFHHYYGGRVVHIHLGLYGAFTEAPVPLPLPVGQVRMRMVGAEYGTDLRGPTVCELIAEPEIADVVAKLGPDPLRGDADPALAWKRITKSRRTIGALLMDQAVIAGVGQEDFEAMWTDLVALMKVGVRRGKIVVVAPEHDHGAPSYGPGRPRTYVYRRAGEACRVCGTSVRTAELEGRNLFWCPTCQV